MIRALASSNDPLAAGLLDLAHRLFPPALLEPDEQLRREMDGGGPVPYRYLVWDSDGLGGFVRFARLRLGATFVVHIAVEPARQGRGIGHALLLAAREAGGGGTLVAEVEPGPSMAWWLREGAIPITPAYTQPALRPETEPFPLALVALGTVEDATGFVEAFYREVWELESESALVKRAVAGVRA